MARAARLYNGATPRQQIRANELQHHLVHCGCCSDNVSRVLPLPRAHTLTLRSLMIPTGTAPVAPSLLLWCAALECRMGLYTFSLPTVMLLGHCFNHCQLLLMCTRGLLLSTCGAWCL